jgi:hypothetical protein
MISAIRGFSLVEVIAALGMSLGVGLAVFHLFHQNERVFRDQNLIVEMQQSARMAASQIADEIRMAGEGVPIYASTFDVAPAEPVAAFLGTSTTDRIAFRTGLSDTETYVRNAPPIDLTLDASATLAVANGSVFTNPLGTSRPSGRFVYIWGPSANATWGWTRAELINISPTALTVAPRQAGDAGRSGNVIRFSGPPTVVLEEVVSFFISAGSIKRGTAIDMTNQANPTWSPAQDLGRDFTSLGFTYYDRNNRVVSPDSLSDRISIARVDVRVIAQTAGPLSTGYRTTYPLSLRTIPRNTRIR